MNYTTIIYSNDKIRGGILQKVLKRHKIKVLLKQQLFEIQKKSSKIPIDVLIIDLKDSSLNEIKFCKSLMLSLKDSFFIILGSLDNLSDISANNNLAIFCDPLDPETIAQKVKEFLSLRNESKSKLSALLEKDLKQFLKLN